MAIDPTQPVQPGAPFDLNGWLQAQAQAAAQQAVVAAQQALTGQASALEARVSSLEGTVDDALAKAAPGLIADVAGAGTAILRDVETDSTTQRILVGTVVGGLVAMALIIVVAALAGNHQAASWILGAPAAIGLAVAWLSHSGVTVPTLKKTPPAN